MQISHFDMAAPLSDRNGSQARDILAIDKLWRQIGNDEFARPPIDPEMAQAVMIGLDYYVARQRRLGQIIGAVSIADCKRGLAKIDSLAVDPEYQRQGIGLKLAEVALGHCAERDFGAVTVTAMPASRKIFEKLGFEVFEVHDTGNSTMFLDL